ILTTLSYVSLMLVLLTHRDITYISYFPYFISTLGATIIIVIGFLHSDVYDVYDRVDSIGILKSTIRCIVHGILLLTAFLFVFKISDNLSRQWLATWSLTSTIALGGLRLLSGYTAESFRRSGRLTKTVAIVGASEVAQQLAATLNRERVGTRLVGIYDERQSRIVGSGNGRTTVRSLPVLY